jgi:hypothetical protein
MTIAVRSCADTVSADPISTPSVSTTTEVFMFMIPRLLIGPRQGFLVQTQKVSAYRITSMARKVLRIAAKAELVERVGPKRPKCPECPDY